SQFCIPTERLKTARFPDWQKKPKSREGRRVLNRVEAQFDPSRYAFKEGKEKSSSSPYRSNKQGILGLTGS
ncbi:hypothetical protein DBR06_SOUSAS7610071, partial [Sousa chinensis]